MPRITRRTPHLDALAGEEIVTRVGQALLAGADMIRAEAAHLITEGAVSGKNHVPSLPGEPPNEDTGVLRENIEALQIGQLQAEVSSNAPYAVALQFGTSRMAPRPYMDVATENVRTQVVALVERAVDSVVGR